jgi:exosortase A-associated hydrolase 2
VQPEAFFLPAGDGTGARFCLYHAPEGDRVRGLVLYVHPFAEEMNKSRRMAALQSRALSKAGYGVLQIDLLGCGDSSGDFGDATWQAWIDDVLLGCRWLQKKAQAALWLWGLRAGCLIAAAATLELRASCNLLFWQPTPNGRAVLQQFLRLKVAADMASGGARGAMEAMRQELAVGNAIDVAGYRLTPAVAAPLEQAKIQSVGSVNRVAWIELSPHGQGELSPAATLTLSEWSQRGVAVSSRSVPSPAFWQTTEIEEAPALLEATLAALHEPALV